MTTGNESKGSPNTSVEGLYFTTKRTWFVYILRRADRTYYVGTTQDLRQRLQAHNEGRAALYTNHRRPVELIHSEKYNSIEGARKRELQIKRWSRAKKRSVDQR